MERKIYKQLLEWKDSARRKPLILNGVRQCGKTYVLKQFGQREIHAVRFSLLPYKTQDNISNIPLYAVMLLRD